MQIKVLLLALTLIATSLAADPVPKPWPKVWRANFTEHLYHKATGHTVTKGNWFYNFETEQLKTIRYNGAGDELCGTTSGYKNNTVCETTVTKGNRYLYFPESKFCCRCCSVEDGCGTVRPDWFVTGKYLGKLKDSGFVVNKWDKRGGQNNYVSQIAEGKYKGVTLRVFQDPQSNLQYDPTTVRQDVDNRVFNLPVGRGCEKACPKPSKCAEIRGSSLKKVRDLVEE